MGGWVPQKDDLNVKVFENRKSDVAQNLIVDFFLTLTVRGPIHRRTLSERKYGDTELISKKTETLYVELNERAEAANSEYSITGNFLEYIYSVLVVKKHQKIR